MTYSVKRIGEHRGAPRLYFQGQALAQAGFVRGARYGILVHKNKVELHLDAGAGLVSGKGEVPVIDINNATVLEPFKGHEAVKVEMSKGVITISRLPSVAKAAERVKRAAANVVASIAVAGVCFGGGILDHSAHAGLLDAGVKSHTVMVNEIDEGLVEHARQHNPVIDSGTRLYAAPLQELIQDDEAMAQLPPADLLVAGIPCSGASKAGKSKHGLTMMEDHPEVGHLAHGFLVVLNKVNPAVFLLENVPEYQTCASAQIIRQQARDMGYVTQEVVLDAQDFGSLERRVRWFMVGATRGIDVNLHDLAPAVRPVRTVADILDKHDNHHWGEFAYLKDKAVRDKAAGKGFQMQIVSPSDTKVPTLRKGYHKGGSTDPLLQHPTNPNLLRLFSGDEHARIKGVDPILGEGLSNTDKHIMYGQGVCPGPVIAIASRIGTALRSASDSQPVQQAYRLDRAVG